MAGRVINTVSKPAALKLPETLPGSFFILHWDRNTEQFVIYLDDADRSSYKLGGIVQKVMTQFKIWGLSELGNKAVDVAREFGKAQGIMVVGRQRVIALFDRASKKQTPALNFEEGSQYAGLPNLW